jgi:hypothetical protein
LITVNHAHDNAFAANIASQIVDPGKVVGNAPPIVAGEEIRVHAGVPGCMIFIGNGDSAACHHSHA